MKTFQDYMDLRETSATLFGREVVGQKSLSPKEVEALTAFIKVFDEALEKSLNRTISFLKTVVPDNKDIEKIEDPSMRTTLKTALRKINPEAEPSLGDRGEEIAPAQADKYMNPMN